MKTLKNPRLLHTMIRVGNLERSLSFYIGALGMKELRREEYPEGRFTLVFVGYKDENSQSVLELTHNWDQDSYHHGSGYGHVAVGVQNIYVLCEQLSLKGVKIIRAPGPMKHTASNGSCDVIAFIEDPDGYRIELVEF